MKPNLLKLLASANARRWMVALAVAFVSSFSLFATEVHDAANKGDVERVRALITADPALVRATNVAGNTPLHIAAAAGRPEVVELLLAAKTEVDRPDKYHMTSLMLAAGPRLMDENHPVTQEIVAIHTNALAVATNPTPGVKVQSVQNAANIILDKIQRQAATSTPEELSNRLACVNHLLKAGANVHATSGGDTTALHCAAMSPSGAIMQRLLQAGAPANALNTDQRTSLHIAAALQMHEAAAALLDAGAELEHRDVMGLTPLFYSLSMGTNVTPTFRLLLKRGANANTVNANGNSLLSVAAKTASAETVQLLLQHGADVNAKSGDMRATALHTVAAMGNTPIAAALLKAGAEVDARDKVGATPLFNTSEKGKLEAARLLLDHKADPNRMATGFELQTPLHSAVAGGHLEVARLLIDRGARVMVKDKNDATPLHAAAVQGHPALIKLLLERGASPTEEADARLSTPLACALRGWKFNMNFLAARTNSTPTSPFGSVEDYTEVAGLLVQYGASVHVADSQGRTPLHMAAGASNETGVAWLLERLADVQARDKLGRGTLAHAAGGGSPAIIRVLVKAGADLNARADGNRRVMHQAAESGQPESIKTLHELGLGVGVRDANGATPLHWAAMSKRSAVEMLVQLGADVNAVDVANQTPLHMAAQKGQPETIGALLEAKANPRLRDATGMTPFQRASQMNQSAVVAVFIQFKVTE